MKKENILRIKHPLNPVKDKDSKILILGSFPSVKSRELNFYYMNKYNRFYRVISSLLKEDFINASIEMKIELFLKHNIAIHDVVKECEIVNSSDSSINVIEYLNLDDILANSNIKHIFLNGNKAYELFIKKYPHMKDISTKLMSTSSANARCSLEVLINNWKIILDYLN
jgi:hypoxanthine-DNA glycosylase